MSGDRIASPFIPSGTIFLAGDRPDAERSTEHCRVEVRHSSSFARRSRLTDESRSSTETRPRQKDIRQEFERGFVGMSRASVIIEARAALVTDILGTMPTNDVLRDRALAAGVICYLGKPLDQDVLHGSIRSALTRPKPSEKA
jgi:hypothetical protein